jgi:hypothetical protein
MRGLLPIEIEPSHHQKPSHYTKLRPLTAVADVDLFHLIVSHLASPGFPWAGFG